eukprot:TRINITY_DN7918_c0_g3_i1.p1 TRINITY_DN7918_c0_g3~~TRINITY_DN7918_c0_g3_i1.p1  ORF type:complete len:468 (-),score=87.09 TRINITY_DN7918_c0_g3_i1:50-1453(-)
MHRAGLLPVLLWGACSQVCRNGGSGICSEAALEEIGVPFGEAALWAASAVPEGCDAPGPQCSWQACADAWRYALNNLRLAVESASEQDKSWLPIDQVHQLHGFMSQLGREQEMWYTNWGAAAPTARGLIADLRPWLSSEKSGLRVPRADIGTRFPTPGRRSVSVPTDGDKSSSVTLSNGFAMPVLGFGTWQLPADGTTYRSVLAALEEGYRHIDTAQAYGNELEVGKALADSGVPRGEVCLVTKLSDVGDYVKARARFEQQLQQLGVDYVDIYMLHSPGRSAEERRLAWQQLEQLYEEGRIKALGVSNFDIAMLKELLAFARIRPVYVQNKYSIYQPGGRDEGVQDESLMEWLVQERMVMTGYSIIHPEHGGYLSPMEDPHVKAIAARHGKTASQVLHRWLLQLGAAVIPRSTRRQRIRENGNLFDFALPETDMRLLNGIVGLLKSDQSGTTPVWLEDVYGASEFRV